MSNLLDTQASFLINIEKLETYLHLFETYLGRYIRELSELPSKIFVLVRKSCCTSRVSEPRLKLTFICKRIGFPMFAHFLWSSLLNSGSDPYNFDSDPDPDPRIRIRDDGSGSEVTFDSVNRIFPIKCYARL